MDCLKKIVSGVSVLAFLCSTAVFGQISTERQALNNIDKGKWEKAKGRLAKSIRKDSVNAAAQYVLSTYFFTYGNPDYHIDSAYYHVMKALADFNQSSQKQRDRLRRFPVDSTFLIQRREAIDSAGFDRAKRVHTEKGYLAFIERFPFAQQLDRARELRDEVAYVDALKDNTYESFLHFITKYPNASRANDARDRYELLLFEAKIKDKKLASYKMFIAEYPESPHRHLAELQVFEISTASGNPTAFFEFLKLYPQSRLTAKAKNILYHILKEQNKPIPSSILSDSIRNIRALEQGYLVPFFKDEKFGFMNADGKEVIRAYASDLDKEYFCGNITEELLAGDNKVIARNGSVIFTGKVQGLDDLGYGFVLVQGKECASLIHKSGFTIEDCIQDARVVGGAYLSLLKKDRWTIATFTGRTLPIGEFEDVTTLDELIIVRQAGKRKLIDKEDLAKAADQLTPEFSKAYDDIRRWNNSMLWVRVDDRQALVTMDLKEKISLGKKEIEPAFFGALSKIAGGYKLYNFAAGESEIYEAVKIQKPWIAVKKEGKWGMLNQYLKPVEQHMFDSVHFIGPFNIALKSDSMRVYVSLNTYIPISSQASVRFLPGKDSTYFLLIEEKELKSIYTAEGEKLFTSSFDKIEFAGENLFFVTKKEKRGLVNREGKIIVTPEYDAMGNLNEGAVVVLKDKKFGFLDVQNRREIKPVFEKNLIRFNANYLIAFKGGYYGIIDWSTKPFVPFEYEEIRYWNDSTALVKRNFQWIIYNFVDKKIIADKIREFKWLHDTPEEKLMIYRQENNYGVISNRRGIVLPATYSDIINLGSSMQPLYFTEKHVEEASIYVVIYYDENGKLLRRQVFEIDDYERIYCSKN